jgi:hypothetical protein
MPFSLFSQWIFRNFPENVEWFVQASSLAKIFQEKLTFKKCNEIYMFTCRCNIYHQLLLLDLRRGYDMSTYVHHFLVFYMDKKCPLQYVNYYLCSLYNIYFMMHFQNFIKNSMNLEACCFNDLQVHLRYLMQ